MKTTDIELFYRPPAWVTGHVSLEDATFLDGMVRETAPGAVVELGVASGCSSAVLLRALSALGGNRKLHSFDLLAHCYFAPERPVGAAVAELLPEVGDLWSLNTGCVATDAAARLEGRNVPLAFIDADHRHPWATLDLWALLPALAPDAWVILHDIALARTSEWKVFGPEFLYDTWPGEKKTSVGRGNIGAIRLPADSVKTRQWLTDALRRPWEMAVDPGLLDRLAIPETLRPDPSLFLGLPAELVRCVTEASMQGRELVVWGAGGAGRACLQALLANGVRPDAFVDRDPKKHGQRIRGIPVRRIEDLDRMSLRPFVVVASMYTSEIEPELWRKGFGLARDYFCFNAGTATTAPAEQSPTETDTTGLLGMTTSEEQDFLFRCARDAGAGTGAIVDLGCWLGSTTIPLARGLEAAGAPPERIVHAYDTFVWHEWMERYSRELKGRFAPGDSFLPEFRSRLGGLAARVRARPGDLAQVIWQEGPIELLVVDAMKSWELCSAITHGFLPAVLPGTGLVMHQDFKFWGCPWIHLTMYRLREYFEIAQDLAHSTGTVFRLVKPLSLTGIPAALRPTDFALEEIDAAYAYWDERLIGPLAPLLAFARLFVLAEIGAVSEARNGVETLLRDGRDLPERLLEILRDRLPGVALPMFWTKALTQAVSEGRPVWMWGAGSGGLGVLQGNGVLRAVVKGVIDSNPAKAGGRLLGVPISGPGVLESGDGRRPYVVVATSFVTEVAARLQQSGYFRYRDFCVADLGGNGGT